MATAGTLELDSMKVAALCVHPNTVYRELLDVDCYDQKRDCRNYKGGMPIVAHPPCRAWSAYCRHQAKPERGERWLAPWCVIQLKRNGGVLEHPAFSKLWDFMRLPKPGEGERDGFWSMAVDQAWWGDTRKKKTWLLFCGVSPQGLPEVPYVLRNDGGDYRRWQLMSKRQRAATSRQMAEWLVEVARLV